MWQQRRGPANHRNIFSSLNTIIHNSLFFTEFKVGKLLCPSSQNVFINCDMNDIRSVHVRKKPKKKLSFFFGFFSPINLNFFWRKKNQIQIWFFFSEKKTKFQIWFFFPEKKTKFGGEKKTKKKTKFFFRFFFAHGRT